jgi:uncharacterized membrane protein
MVEFLASPWPQGIVALLALLILVVAAYHGLKRFRERIDEDEVHPARLLSNFEEIHARGGLTATEYRTIKNALASRLQREIKDNAQKG